MSLISRGEKLMAERVDARLSCESVNRWIPILGQHPCLDRGGRRFRPPLLGVVEKFRTPSAAR